MYNRDIARAKSLDLIIILDGCQWERERSEICKAEPTRIKSEYLTSKRDNRGASSTILSNTVTYNSYTHFATNTVALGGHAKEKISAVCSD